MQIANERLGGGASGNSQGSYGSGAGDIDEKDVIVLTDNTFE